MRATVIGSLTLAVLGVAAAPAPAQDGPSLREVQDAYNAGLREKRWEKFRELAEAYAAGNPGNFDAPWLMANSHVNEGNPSASLPWFQKASDIDHTHFMAAFETGVTFMRYVDSDPKAMEKALPYLERAVAARGAPEPKGLPSDENYLKMADFVMGPALIEAHYQLKAFDKCKALAQAEMQKQPLSSIPCYYLGVFAEEADDRAVAIDLYRKGAAANLDKPFNSVFHKWGLEDKRSACNDRATFLDNTTVRYGEVLNGGLRFKDGEKGLQVDLPDPRILKLKKGDRYPWLFLFPKHEATGGGIITHVIKVARPSTGVGMQLDVDIDIYGGGPTVQLNGQDGNKYKWSEPESLAEGLFTDFTKYTWKDVTDVKKLRKSQWGKGYKGFEFSFKGREKSAIDNYEKHKAAGERVIEPPVWENHVYLAKGKAMTWYVHLQAKGDFYQRYQKEIVILLRGISFPD